MKCDSEITLRMENWHGGDWDETQNGPHVMRRKGCTMQNKGITLIDNIFSKKVEENIISGNLISDVSNHFAVLSFTVTYIKRKTCQITLTRFF